MIIDSDQIEQLIPHRPPFLFLDKCQIIKNGFEGFGYKIFHTNEFFFKGHFPSYPIVPGVILIEAMAQTAGVVVSKEYENYKHKNVLFMSVNKAKFRKPVHPEDEIIFKVKRINNVRSVYKFFGEAFVKNIRVCEAEFSAMITYNN